LLGAVGDARIQLLTGDELNPDDVAIVAFEKVVIRFVHQDQMMAVQICGGAQGCSTLSTVRCMIG